MRVLRVWLGLLSVVLGAWAHVGNPDVYLDGQAGPYRLFITVRPPQVIPGVASIEVRSASPGLKRLTAVPVPLSGDGAKWAPVADPLQASTVDPQFFTGSLWIMAAGSWQVRLAAEGSGGSGLTAVPVPSVAITTRGMNRGLSAFLSVLLILLVTGLICIAGAAVREALLPAGREPGETERKGARQTMIATGVVVAALLLLGRAWWQSDEAAYRQNIFQPLRMEASLASSGQLTLLLHDPAGRTPSERSRVALRPVFFSREIDDLVPDHDHLMHLYAIRQPGLDVLFHLHPELSGAGVFRLALPVIPAGHYRLYADIVHANGFPETLVSSMDVPSGLPGRALWGDDASGSAKPLSEAAHHSLDFELPDGYQMRWIHEGDAPEANKLEQFRFALFDRSGRPASDVKLYMGMLGHAAFVKADGTAFAHVHPAGSVAMASLDMAERQLPHDMGAMAGMSAMGGMEGEAHGRLPNSVSFPYGFPSSGSYRIFVQMKHGETIETGIFDTFVSGT